MASQADHDSALQFSFGSPIGSEEGALPVDADRNGDLPMLDLLSDDPLPPLPDDLPLRKNGPAAAVLPLSHCPTPSSSEKQAAGEFWLEGDVLMCGCPKCRAPMSVRLWLMVADCWQCATSIELSEEQELEAQRLMNQRQQTQRRAAATSTAAAAAATAASSLPQDVSSGAKSKRERTPPPRPRRPAPATVAAATVSPPRPRRQAAEARTQDRIRKLTSLNAAEAWLNDILEMTPAWLISLVFHFVLLILLALISLPDKPRSEEILLSNDVSQHRREGGDVVLNPQDDDKFDLPVLDNIDLSDPVVKKAMLVAQQDAREIRLDPNAPNEELPELESVKKKIGDPHGFRSALAARDPRVRIDMVRREGGTTMTEAAVARGLRWMSKHQNADGSWSLHAFHQAGKCNCGQRGSVRSDTAGTALVLLPFLGAGQTHITPGPYRDTVSKGLRWLVEQQKENGDLRGNSAGNAGMYAHGQAAIVLCEAFAMTGDENLRVPAQKSIDFIVEAQHAGGGWRYAPKQAGDTSVVGWQLMALQSARVAGLTVPDSTFILADAYLDSVESKYKSRDATDKAYDGATLYSYMGNKNPREAMTAEALLCRMYLGWTNEQEGLLPAANFLLERHPPLKDNESTKNKKPSNIYYLYYATQVMHHVGGEQWEKWNLKMRNLMVSSQEKRGHQAGSWTPIGQHDKAGGRLYMTALSTCTLEVYYRHLPIFRQIDLEADLKK